MLAPTLLYFLVMNTVQLIQIYLVVNYSIQASGRNIPTSTSNDISGGAAQEFDDHIEYLLQSYRESVLSENSVHRGTDFTQSRVTQSARDNAMDYDPDFLSREEEEDRKFREIMMDSIRLDNHILC